jgi:hypothetical protein
MQDATLSTAFAVSWKSRHLNIDFGSQPILHRNCVRSVQIPLGNVYLIFSRLFIRWRLILVDMKPPPSPHGPTTQMEALRLALHQQLDRHNCFGLNTTISRHLRKLTLVHFQAVGSTASILAPDGDSARLIQRSQRELEKSSRV